ncbi:MAG: ribonuclease R [Deltaproteobacteria bacterium GWB2_55_19]|nr:MAG: ribonuclease R [Deltaproteobacteria bacterium GWB2_55_19]
MEPIEKKIIDYLAEGPQSFKDLVRSFEIGKEDRDRFKKVVKVMVAEGALIKTRGGRFGLPSKMNLTTGRLSCHPDGFGFVKPEEGGADVYVNARRLSGAMHGDTVAARIEGIKSGGRREGSVLRIIKRAHKTVVGRFEKARGVGILTPSDEKLLYQVIIPKEEFGNAADGQIVIAEITRWPARNLAPMGRVVEVIGNPDDPDVEAEVILKKYGLPHRFPADVLHEVLSVPSSVSQAEIAGRTDLRTRTTVTIDGETAKDFDDAVSIERTTHGYRLWVSIADVSHYVREGTAIDSEAYARGTSVYFPDRAIPMLPEALSNGICSLNPQVERLTMTAELEFDAKGSVVGKSFYESVIKSAERMTYTNVKKLIRGEDAEIEKRYSRILPDIKIMAELAKKLTERRMEAGSIDFDLPEPQIIIDLKGNVEDIVRSERNEAHKLIEEFMLAANKAVAGEFSSRSYPFVYRVHEEPDADSIHDFAEFASSFGLHFKDGLGPLGFQQVLKAVEGRPEEKLINQVLLRSMKQAVYSEENVGHFGLAFKDYTHFTSPIRRYPDLVVHRLLKLLIHGKYTAEARERMESALPPVCGHTSARERKAMEAEREIADLKKTQFMSDKVGEAFEGLISGVTSFGVFVELKDYFVEGLVHVSTLLDDYYIFDEKRHSLIGERKKRVFRLGDAVSVKVTRADVERRRIDLVLDEAFADKPRKQGGQRPRESGGRGSKRKR